MTTTTTTTTKTGTTDHLGTLHFGMQVRLNDGSELGTFTVMSDTLHADGSVNLYGGDVDKGGYRKYRAIMPERLKLEDRKDTLRKLHRMAA